MTLSNDCSWIHIYINDLPKAIDKVKAAKKNLTDFKKYSHKNADAIKSDIMESIDKEISKKAVGTQAVVNVCVNGYINTKSFDAGRFLESAIPVNEAFIDYIVEAIVSKTGKGITEGKYNKTIEQLQAKYKEAAGEVTRIKDMLKGLETFETNWKVMQQRYSEPIDKHGYVLPEGGDVQLAYDTLGVYKHISSEGRPAEPRKMKEIHNNPSARVSQRPASKQSFMDGIFGKWLNR